MNPSHLEHFHRLFWRVHEVFGLVDEEIEIENVEVEKPDPAELQWPRILDWVIPGNEEEEVFRIPGE